jgi:hypothetical protein
MGGSKEFRDARSKNKPANRWIATRAEFIAALALWREQLAAGQNGGDVMLELLDRQQRLTGNQRRIVFAAILGDMLEFFDYFLIGFVLAFIVGPWKLTYGQSALILLSSGIGAIIGAWFWGWLADRIGRRKVFIAEFFDCNRLSRLYARAWMGLSHLVPFPDRLRRRRALLR